jgi:hypothetical protein
MTVTGKRLIDSWSLELAKDLISAEDRPLFGSLSGSVSFFRSRAERLTALYSLP